MNSWSIFWVEYLRLFGGLAFLVAITVWLSKALVTNSFAKDLKLYGSQIDFLASAYKDKLSQLNTDRAKVLKELYAAIVLTERYLGGIGIGPAEDKERAERLYGEHYLKLCNLHAENRIYLDVSDAEVVDTVISLFSGSATHARGTIPLLSLGGTVSENANRELQLQHEATQKALSLLQDKFRELLGSNIKLPTVATIFPPVRLWKLLKFW